MRNISRRGILKGLVVGASVLGFDPRARSWVTEASADTSFTGLPPLDGTLSTDPTALAEESDDFGHIVHRVPLAVLYAGSIDNVVAMVKYAGANGLRIVGRGNGHTTFGQSQCDAGIVIDLRSLNTIHSISDDGAVVDAGVMWRDLLLAATGVGLTPPVLTDYLYLTVGGTLSVGGIGGMSFRHGAEVDNVVQLTVVTGTGDVVVCSPDQYADLFNVALAGLGLCAIIVGATIRLIKAKERAVEYDLYYPDVSSMLDDIRILVAEDRFSYVRGNAVPGTSTWGPFYIVATKYYTPTEEPGGAPDSDDLLAGLSFIPGATQTVDRTYFDFCDVTDQLFVELGQAGLLGLPHPWLDIFVPGSAIDSFASQTLASEDVSLFLPGSLLLFFPFNRDLLTCPMFQVPDESIFFLFDIIRTAPADPNVVDAVLQDNRRLYDQNVALGGKSYTISAVEMSPADWRAHFGFAWPLLSTVKAIRDPGNILGAGVAVFP